MQHYINRGYTPYTPVEPSNTILFGSARPGFPHSRVSSETVTHWMAFMVASEFKKIICLLNDQDLVQYYTTDLIAQYRRYFEAYHFPIEDFSKIPANVMSKILLCVGPEKTLVHCSAGMGRTGQVMYAYLLKQGYAPKDALEICIKQGRNPFEYMHR